MNCLICRESVDVMKDMYSVFTYFTESFSLDSSKTIERMVIKLCMRQSYQNCEVSV